ncbi:MAG: hypothetical protein OQK49_06665 [Proteobacteria bacterium]|nr:hypothetical protein [Pseudomonadota bacterium]
MIAVIKGDIMASRQLAETKLWLLPLKKLLSQWGQAPTHWELVWGDSFQLETADMASALYKALSIKALIKQVTEQQETSNISPLDVRLAIGLGNKSYSGERISESNGPAFIHADEVFTKLEKNKCSLGIKSPWLRFDDEINLYLTLAATFMDEWSVSSAQLVSYVLKHPQATQSEIGQSLGIKQNSVSGRWHRAHVKEMLAVEAAFRQRLQEYKT